MIKRIKIIEENEPDITKHWDEQENVDDIDLVFRKLRRDSVGKSASNPTWGYVFNVRDENLKLNIDSEGLYKEHDYDAPNAPYAEKLFSIIGRRVLDNTRVPKVDIVMARPKEPSVISYKLMNNDIEDMFHISDLMFYKYDREQLTTKKNIFTIGDILECVKEQVQDKSNYKQIERNIIHTLLLDAVVNNADRHNNNWALVRNKETNLYELAAFDHSSSFVDMIEERRYFTSNGWVGSYVTVEENIKFRRGSVGDAIIRYIAKNYSEYFDEFADIFNEKLPSIIAEIKEENLPIDINRLELKLNQRNRFLSKIKSRGDSEYGEQ